MSSIKKFAALSVALSMTTSATAATNGACVTEAEGAATMAAMMPANKDGGSKGFEICKA